MSIYAQGRIEKAITLFLSKIISKDYIGRILFFYRITARKINMYLERDVSERVIEYPWLLKNLNSNEPRILDVGCSGSYLSHELIARGYDTYGIDLEPYPEKRSDLKFFRGDVRNTPFHNCYFDQIIAISTIEHIGDKEINDNGDFIAMKELNRILKKSGKMLLSLPCSNEYLHKKGRNYDESRLKSLILDFQIEKEEYYMCNGKGKWVKTSRKIMSKITYDHKKPMSVVLLKLRK